MKRVVIESPFAGDRPTNLAYLRRAMCDCIKRGEAPFASHALYTQEGVLEDDIPAERKLGIEAGFAWAGVAQLVAVYEDLGITPGMRFGIERHTNAGLSIEYRKVPNWKPGIGVGERVRVMLFADGTLECEPFARGRAGIVIDEDDVGRHRFLIELDEPAPRHVWIRAAHVERRA
jgi:hypothetical protein